MKASEAKRLKELEAENARLKKMVANQALDIDMLKELSAGNFSTPNRKRSAVEMLRDRFGAYLTTARLHGGGHPPIHDAPGPTAAEHPGSRVTHLAAPICHRPAPLGVAAGRQDGAPRWLAGQQQAHPPALA